MTCARFAPMLGARPGELSAADARALADHLATCDDCQARLADEEALSGMLGDALMAESNRRDFSTFSDEVLGRIPEYRGARPGATGRPADLARTGLWGWVRHHRAFAAAGALAPALAAVLLVVYVGRSQAPAPGDEVALQVSAEGRGATVLYTSEGPVVLLGDDDEPAGT
jgi:anti-sigma factor RsiW